MDYEIVIERIEHGYAAYVRQLPGCAVVGETEAEVRELISKAIELHLEPLLGD